MREMMSKMNVEEGAGRGPAGSLAEQWAHEMKAQGREAGAREGEEARADGLGARELEVAGERWADELRESEVPPLVLAPCFPASFRALRRAGESVLAREFLAMGFARVICFVTLCGVVCRRGAMCMGRGRLMTCRGSSRRCSTATQSCPRPS